MSRGELTEAERAEQTAIIARQNDEFRAGLALGPVSTLRGMALVTPGVFAMGAEFLALLHLSVAGFADFTEDNDPYGDHSFGVVEICGTRVFWKIDLYDADYTFGSDYPADPEQTCRVLTLLLPSEY